jgi:hypothetical protein
MYEGVHIIARVKVNELNIKGRVTVSLPPNFKVGFS